MQEKQGVEKCVPYMRCAFFKYPRFKVHHGNICLKKINSCLKYQRSNKAKKCPVKSFPLRVFSEGCVSGKVCF